MQGPKPKHTIQLLDKEIAELRQVIGSRKAPRGKVSRAKIVLAAHEHPEGDNQETARGVGRTDRSVRT
jgi:hypothetical protein